MNDRKYRSTILLGGSSMSPYFTPQQKKVIFFDMNNTLVDRRKCFDSAFLEVIGELVARWDISNTIGSPQDALHSYKLEWSRHRKVQIGSNESANELRRICLTKALEAFPVTVTAPFSENFFNGVEDAEESYVTLFPGVEDMLKQLSQRYTLAIISNGNQKRLERNLHYLKLSKYIAEDRLFSSSQDGPRKPHPSMFEQALKTTGTLPSQSLMVGNSWKNDIMGATRCGLDAVWIHPSHMKKVSQRNFGKQKVIIIRAIRQLTYILA
jgi:FMN phosphatase YigB (HAD superfamily)